MKFGFAAILFGIVYAACIDARVLREGRSQGGKTLSKGKSMASAFASKFTVSDDLFCMSL
jgi:hypothetical protein